jgi:hypothetical protein
MVLFFFPNSPIPGGIGFLQLTGGNCATGLALLVDLVDFYFLHPSSSGLGFHSPCCVTLARIFPTGYQTTYWDPSCTFFLKQRRDLHKEPTQGTTSTMECPA